ncbi:hypothetical protein SEA_MAGICMAN_31 [Gordonia phage MagicMan]|nr:hypothetical protein SEA_MAGICMAN_31 [Gordonia phage MagicMan]
MTTTTTSAPSSSVPVPPGDSPTASASIYDPLGLAVTEAMVAHSHASSAMYAATYRDYIKLATGATTRVRHDWSASTASLRAVPDSFAAKLAGLHHVDWLAPTGSYADSGATDLLTNRLNRLSQLRTADGYSELGIPRPTDESVLATRRLVTSLAIGSTALALTKLFPSEEGGIDVRVQTESMVITISVRNDDPEKYHADMWEIATTNGIPMKGRDVVRDLQFASSSSAATFLHAVTTDDI